jgi:hypothetical protein
MCDLLRTGPTFARQILKPDQGKSFDILSY